ncbi:UDP-N-acetylmuramoyl-tripeptide--D-alanyl-D-alanine ligase [Aestuariibaculum suncheonense]|uniref:UDP-N-acetylmuramoyl-tripeptide--D-alanyl-D-alanine ligase n=1 Tax=Aestuariibaculum suncheonense TaxID=1028745 RepID=A0A8J6Q451_9FLAO|nr:UDP-N-acetylmuramoyl-tripeptide--D-alanyl-D-alanine ligase [Aestuariibaculum suncheonense]MBD0834262.1 UDP-N-acetylmuramoyl-tripeptide--D-alanyl-D-alanine ligase [Aestuariibaculum suncheonense]
MKIAQIHSLFLECHAASTDTRKIKENDMFFALKGENFNGNKYAEQALQNGAKYCVIDEEEFNTSSQTILVDNVLDTLQQLATYHRNYLKLPIIALTGSNGKTTTKELINATLSKKYKTTATIGNLNNHIGVPLTLLSMTKNTEIGIVEMGANHLKEIEALCKIAQPDFGYITNFGKAHLEGFGSVEGVIKGKSEMYDYLITNNKTLFVNGSDAIQLEKTANTNRIVFGDTEGFDITIQFVEAQPNVKLNYNHLTIQSQLIGAYNFNNIAAAITMANHFRVDDNDIKIAIEDYSPTNNRSQVINKGTCKIILDAYNANPTSMKAALSNFDKLNDNNKIAIIGDMFELGKEAKEEHENIIKLSTSLNINKVIVIGENFFNTQTTVDNLLKFQSFDDFKANFNIEGLNHSTLLIKGSRGMAMERILDLV